MATSRSNKENVRAKKTRDRAPNRDEFEKSMLSLDALHDSMRRNAVSRNR